MKKKGNKCESVPTKRLYEFEKYKYHTLIEQCKKNRKRIGYTSYIKDIYFPFIIALMPALLPFIVLICGKLWKITGVVIGIVVLLIVFFFFMRLYKNRYSYMDDLLTKPIEEKKQLCSQIMKDFNLKNAQDILDKENEMTGAFVYFAEYRKNILVFTKWLVGALLGALITLALHLNKSSASYLLYIYALILVSLIALPFLIFYLCTSGGYEFYNFWEKNFLIPNGKLLSYSRFYLEYCKKVLPEIRCYEKNIYHLSTKSFNTFIKNNLKRAKKNDISKIYDYAFLVELIYKNEACSDGKNIGRKKLYKSIESGMSKSAKPNDELSKSSQKLLGKFLKNYENGYGSQENLQSK